MYAGQSGDSPVLQNVVTQLENENVDDDVTPARVVHLCPADCTNIMVTMKSMIQGFVSTSPEGVNSSQNSLGVSPDTPIYTRKRKTEANHVVGGVRYRVAEGLARVSCHRTG